MKKGHSREEISAFIDGEARNEAAVNRLLQHDEAAAQYHMQLLKIASHLQSLPEEPVREAFTAAVMAKIEAPAPAPRTAWRWLSLPQMAVATAIVGIALGLWWITQGFYAPPEAISQAQAHAMVEQSVQWTSDDVLLQEFMHRLEIGQDLAPFEMDAEAEGENEGLPLEEVLVLLATDLEEENWTRAPFWEADPFSLLEELDEEEAAVMGDLLQAYLAEWKTRG